MTFIACSSKTVPDQLRRMDFVTATYRLACESQDAVSLARQIALEQTVEVPESLLVDPYIQENVVGRVRSVRPEEGSPHHFLAVVDYPAWLAGPHIGQVWNLLFGNVSLKRGIRLVHVDLPPALLSQLPGPRYGIHKFRELLGIWKRPLLATALKPRGSSPDQFAEAAYQFALGGGDLVKDDHNLVDASFDEFRSRVDLCQSRLEQARQQTGRHCVYAPNFSPAAENWQRQAEFLIQRGIQAVLVAPLLLGMDTVRALREEYPLFLMAHPTFTGAMFHDPDHGVDPSVLLGQWFRLIGCDATIFPNYGGRFTFSPDECRSIATVARSHVSGIEDCWPTPAGGMAFDRLPEMAEAYGQDSIFLIGGALLGDQTPLMETTRRFATQIEELFPDHHCTAVATASEPSFISACELPVPSRLPASVLERLAFRAGYQWDGRSATAYKMNAALPFHGISRTELIGTHGEQTSFDVRYFEIEPGGYSSLEKHQHTHVIIGLRGHGELVVEERPLTVSQFDVAYVAPFKIHQLLNRSDEPFGFLCIVDHERDRPQSP